MLGGGASPVNSTPRKPGGVETGELMPGWYVHMEAAKLTAQRLQKGQVPPGSPLTAAQAQELGRIAHDWRNYLAAGALGPDMFYLLPDFKGDAGAVILAVVKWVLDTWEDIDEAFIGRWERWMDNISANDEDLSNQLTGGLAEELGEALSDLASSINNAMLTLLTRFGDIFGLLTSGPPQGFDNDAFYWSDMFHYRNTYQFPWQMFADASRARDAADDDDDKTRDAESLMAFAMGWMTHCGTDVAGHPFTNVKCGGPYRLHWQRHHLIENHMDSLNYDRRHGGDEFYGEIGTSAQHFRIAFRPAADPPVDSIYAGRQDQPAYDYFTGFPAYDLGDTGQAKLSRHKHFDLDSEVLPDHLVTALIDTMRKVFKEDAPKVLTHDPDFNDEGSGRPNADALQEMWQLVYRYLKMTGSDGLSPTMPTPPTLFSEHPLPSFPGTGGPAEDPARGAPDDDDFNLLDLLLAIVAVAIWVAQMAVWVATILPSLILDPLTFPAREAVYRYVLMPAWNLYMLSRRLLVMEGFLVPKPDEIDFGLTHLGHSPRDPWAIVLADLGDPTGFYSGAVTDPIDEPSGRPSPTDEFSKDKAFPRAIVADVLPIIAQLGLNAGPLLPAIPRTPSEWVAPWKYPEKNVDGTLVGWEAPLTHPGPYVIGQDAGVLLTPGPGDQSAIGDFESAPDAETSYQAAKKHLVNNHHLGHPVDYSTYLVARLAAAKDAETCPVPDMNLDSDRGYAWHAWDWVRHLESEGRPFLCVPPVLGQGDSGNTVYAFQQPCTVPEMYASQDYPPPTAPAKWRADVALQIRYLTGGDDPACDPEAQRISERDTRYAGDLPPAGTAPSGGGSAEDPGGLN